jgi:hypothetical protein
MGMISDSNKGYFDDQVATADVLDNGGVQGALTVGTSSVEVKVGANRHEGRKSVTLYNNSNTTIYWGFNNSVTTATGTPITKGQFIEWTVGENTPIWVIAGNANNNMRITEAS